MGIVRIPKSVPRTITSDGGGTMTRLLEELNTARSALTRATRWTYPTAARVSIRVDRSHDEPHGHVQAVFDRDNELLADGTSKAWFDDFHTVTIDEAAYDWYFSYQAFIADVGFEGPVDDVITVTLQDSDSTSTA